VGWLRDLIETSELRVKSLGNLAKVALDQADWPSEVRIQPRSLSALLGKIDRGQEVGWLAARVGVQVALARALGIGVDEVTRGLRAAEPASLAEGRLIRLRDLPAARPLDLWNEPLPPGLPELTGSGLGPARWWVAPSGAGRTLLGLWLQARGRARYAPPPTAEWLDPEPQAPVFLELDESSPRTLRVPPRPGLIVAAPFAAPDGFEIVETLPLAAAVEPLVRWALERLPPDTRLVFERATSWLGERVAAGDVSTVGALLGLLGLADDQGARAIETRSLERLAKRYVEERLVDALDPTLSQSGWLRQHGFEAVIGLVERSLVDSDRHPAEARSIDEWLALVPHELERTVDVDWVRLSLRNVDSGVRPSEIERAARRLPPGAYRLVTALEQAGLLRRLGDGRLKLGPSFLAELLERKAFLSLSARSPVEWGEALLRPYAAPQLAEVLLDRALESGTSFLEPVLDLTPNDEPEYAITLDLSLRIAGVTRLLGGDVSQEMLEGLWGEARSAFVELDGEAPRPILEPSLVHGAVGRTARRGRQLLARGTALIAALSISETLARGTRSLAVLSPWNATEPPANAARMYDTIADSLRERPAWYEPSLRLIGRLRALIGNVRSAEAPHELELPAQWVDEIEHGVLTFSALERGLPELDAVLTLTRSRNISAEKLAEALWSAWHDAGEPALAEPFAGKSPWAEFAFRHAAPHWIERWLSAGPPADRLFAWLGSDALRAIARRPEITGRRAALQAMPLEVLDALVHSADSRGRLSPALDVLWARAPSAAESAFGEELRSGAAARAEVLASLLQSTPDAFVPRAVAALTRDDRALTLDREVLDAVRAALQSWSATRASGWRDAFALLRRIERDRRPSA
jgi:hypothetical protein